MPTPNNELLERLREVKAMQLPLTLMSPIDLSMPTPASSSLRTVNRIGSGVASVGSSLDQLSQIKTSFSDSLRGLHGLSSTFSFLALGVAISEFLRLGHAYLFAQQLNEQQSKPVIPLTKKMRLASSGLLITLAIIALTVPIAAIPIAIASAGVGLIGSVVAFSSYYRNQRRLAARLQEIENTIKDGNTLYSDTQSNALVLEQSLTAAIANQDQDEINRLCSTISELHAQTQPLKTTLQQLHDERIIINDIHLKQVKQRVAEKAIGVFLSSVATLGLVLSFFIPPVGIGLMTASAGIGALFITAKVIGYMANKISSFMKNNKTTAPVEQASTKPEPSVNVGLDSNQESTVTMLHQLSASPLPKAQLEAVEDTTKTLEVGSESTSDEQDDIDTLRFKL